ncbi:MAG: sensor histidine kinase [Candidatus Binataceae bacterium]
MDALVSVDENLRIAAIIESLEVGAILLDRNGVVVQINELAALILGIEREEVVDHPFEALDVDSHHYLRVRAALQRISDYPAGEKQIEVSLHVRGREHNYLLKLGELRLPDGTLFGNIVAFHDLTYLRDKDRARSNLVASLSHELKTPLTSLSLAVELLQRTVTDPKQRETIETIGEDLARIRDLSDSLLNVARDETASIAVLNVSFDLAKLVTSVVKKFALQAAQRRVILRVHVGAELESYGDPVKLSWVLSNLLANALRYTPDGGAIEVSATRVGQLLRLSVSDTGPGIPLEIREVIFERHTPWPADGFERGSAGLGLEIAKEIVEAHGGRIFLEISGEGTTFTVDLPQSWRR